MRLWELKNLQLVAKLLQVFELPTPLFLKPYSHISLGGVNRSSDAGDGGKQRVVQTIPKQIINTIP